jgi:hypothetical protein
MQVSRRAIVISAAVLFSAIGIYVSSSSPSGNVVSDFPSTSLLGSCLGEYCVGDFGPGGGTIVYVDDAGFDNSVEDDTSIGAMCKSGTCHYLEMAPTDLDGRLTWDDAIIAAAAFFTPSSNDWVLPSKDALNEMCKYAFGDAINAICNDVGESSLALEIRGFSTANYWSSSEGDHSYFGWAQSFRSGHQFTTGGILPFYVRPVRAF